MSHDKSSTPVQHDMPHPAATLNSPRLNLWPGAIIALLATQIILMLVMVYIATSDRSFAVEPDYYHKALHWDDTAAERQASAELGWSANISISDRADIYKQRDVTCLVTDKAGNPINDAIVDVIAFSHARGSERSLLAFKSMGEGRYTSRTRISRPGLWEFRVVARRAAETFTQIQQLHVTPAGALR